MKKRIPLAIALALLLAACASQRANYSHSILNKRQVGAIDDAIASIAERNTLPRILFFPGDIYDINEVQLFYRLLAIEDIDSLARSHPSPAVRATMGIVLIERAPNAAKRLLADRIGDTATLLTQSYGFCIATRSGNTVGNIMLNYALNNRLFSNNELVTLDSRILADPACRNLNRYHRLTGTPVPRKSFHDMLRYHNLRSPAFSQELLNSDRLIDDTAQYLNWIKDAFRLDGHPRFYLLDAWIRDPWKGYSLMQIYIADVHPERLALLLVDGKYDIVDTLTVAEPIKVTPISATDTLRSRTYFKLNQKPLLRTEEVVLRNGTDTVEIHQINRIYTIEPGRGFVHTHTQTIDN